jgi:serine O-acetyltransferase
VVVGETAEIGDHVTIFQGATLGGTGKEKGKRHPTVGDHVMIGAGAKVLGSFSVGDHVAIGANAVVLRPLPDHSTAVGVPAEVVRIAGLEPDDLGHDQMPDPVHECLDDVSVRLAALEARFLALEKAGKV